MSQDLGIGLEHVVQHVDAVRGAHLRALLQRAHLWVVEVFVGAHEGQQLLLERADLLSCPLSIRDLVQTLTAGLEEFVENWEV